jgi:biopolymer transport protein ExbD/biopolymer transport protein TolR
MTDPKENNQIDSSLCLLKVIQPEGTMKTKNIYMLCAFALLALLLFPVSCAYKRPTVAKRGAAIPNLPKDTPVDFPGDLHNPDMDQALQRDTTVIVSIPTEQQLYVGHDLTPKDQISYRVGELLKLHSEPDQTVYIAAGAGVDYNAVVEALGLIRRLGVKSIGLIAVRKRTDNDSSGAADYIGRFLVAIPPERDPNEDLSKLIPNPLTLVVSISPDLKFSINSRASPENYEPCYGLTPTYGSVNDPDPLTKCLESLFQRRTEQHAYRPGFETRTDLTEENRVEKTIFVKAPRSIKYGAVMRAIDSVKGAGAYPINLQIDDLPQ